MKKVLLCIITAIFAASLIYAEPTPITLKSAMSKAAIENLTLQQLNEKLNNLNLDAHIKNAAFFPTLQANGNYTYVSKQTVISLTSIPPYHLDSNDTYDLNLTLSQVLFSGFRVRESYLLARNRINELEWQNETVANQIRLSTGSIYYQIQSNRLICLALQQSRARINNQLLYVKSMLEQKQAIPYDTLDVANRLLSLDTQISRLDKNEEILNLKFNNMFHEEIEYVPAALNAIDLNVQLESLDFYLKEAQNWSTDLSQIASMKASQRNLIRIQQSQLYPQIVGSAAYHEANPGTDMLGKDWMNYYTVGIGFQWSLWNWGANYKSIRQMRNEEKRLTLQEKQAWLNLQEQIKETYLNLQMAQDQISMHKKLLEQEHERYRILQERYRESQVSALDLSTGEKTLTESQINLEQQYISLFVYKLQMDILIGKFNRGRI